METFTAADIQRVLKYLRLPFSYRPLVVSQMNSALIHTLTTSEERQAYVTETRALLADMDALEVVRRTQGADGGSMLIKADVLEWLPGGQISTVMGRQSELREQLLNHLNLWGLVGNGGGSASVERS